MTYFLCDSGERFRDIMALLFILGYPFCTHNKMVTRTCLPFLARYLWNNIDKVFNSKYWENSLWNTIYLYVNCNDIYTYDIDWLSFTSIIFSYHSPSYSSNHLWKQWIHCNGYTLCCLKQLNFIIMKRQVQPWRYGRSV